MALPNSLEILQAVIEATPDAIFVKDLDGRYLLVNREFERLVRRPRLEVVGHTDRNLFPSALAEQLAARDDEVLRGGAPVAFEQELVVDEARRTYVCVKFPLRGASATHYGVGSMATDITVLKRLQEELQRHQEELAHVLRLLPVYDHPNVIVGTETSDDAGVFRLGPGLRSRYAGPPSR